MERIIYYEMLRVWIPSRGWRSLGGSAEQQLSQPVLQLHGEWKFWRELYLSVKSFCFYSHLSSLLLFSFIYIIFIIEIYKFVSWWGITLRLISSVSFVDILDVQEKSRGSKLLYERRSSLLQKSRALKSSVLNHR